MTFSKTFCSSPWIHMHITNQGNFGFCRGASRLDTYEYNIAEHDILDYFQNKMSLVRMDMLDGLPIKDCEKCYIQDMHGKISQRQKQLLKSGVMGQHFNKSLVGSPWVDEFNYSAKNNGNTNQYPVDWQIDLGNYCNSACVFCTPEYSSRLAQEFKKLGFIDAVPKSSWCNDPILLEKFISTLENIPNLQYLHFLGGETLITPAFKTILQRLINAGKKSATIGFTTNLTVWDDEIVDLLAQFPSVHVGLSIESLHKVNDYIRYPVNTTSAKVIMDRWIGLSHNNGWLVQIRTTPTVLSISYLADLYDYAIANGTIVESCNFINEPAFMRPSVLPVEYKKQAIQKLQTWLDANQKPCASNIVNIRNPNTIQELLSQDVQSYINYLNNQPDETHLLPKLVEYIKKLEQNRKNTILDYLPEYENFLRSAGY